MKTDEQKLNIVGAAAQLLLEKYSWEKSAEKLLGILKEEV